MKISNNKFIGKLWNISELMSQKSFPKFMQLQCVTKLLFYILLVKSKCLNGKEKLRFLNIIDVSCSVSDTTVEDVEKVIQIVCYTGREEESFIETMVRLYKQMKTKTSQSLALEEKSMLQAIKCIHYQAFYSSRVDEIITSDIFLQDNGWIVDKENKEVRPLLFTGTFLISFLHCHSSQQI